MSARFVTTCVNSTREAISPMVDAEQDITRRTFLKHVNRDELADIERHLGYASHPRGGLTMAGDFHVAYYRSTFRGNRCYFFRWSAIEHVFVEASNGR